MELLSILSAMRRNKVGAALIAVQIAVTLAVLCNALFIIQQRLAASVRPTGVDEANILKIENIWIGQPEDLPARVQTDLAALRSLPGVIDAYVTNSFPLKTGGWSFGIRLEQDPQRAYVADTAIYMADEHGLNTLGLHLVAGRNFSADELVDLQYDDRPKIPVAIVTRALAERLFPKGDALGKAIFFSPGSQTGTTRIIGVVDRLQVPWTSGGWINGANNSTLVPIKFISGGSYYLIRCRPGQIAAITQDAQKKLYEVNRERILQSVQTLTQVRADAYRDDRGLAVILAIVCMALLAVTAFGIVGLTSYWVTLRRRQIGIRRALGATRGAIVGYFLTENVLVASAAVAAGIALAIGMNLWMVSSFEMQRLPFSYVLSAAVLVVLLGQGSALWPAVRAAAIPPALATRSA